jgi:hypothetical protein
VFEIQRLAPTRYGSSFHHCVYVRFVIRNPFSDFLCCTLLNTSFFFLNREMRNFFCLEQQRICDEIPRTFQFSPYLNSPILPPITLINKKLLFKFFGNSMYLDYIKTTYISFLTNLKHCFVSFYFHHQFNLIRLF